MYRHEERARQIDNQRDSFADTKTKSEGNASRAHRLTSIGGRGEGGRERERHKDRQIGRQKKTQRVVAGWGYNG